MPGITDPKSLLPDNAVAFQGRVVATLEGSANIAPGEIVFVSDATIDTTTRPANPVPRRLKVERASATSVGRRLVAVNSGEVGDTITCALWAVVQMNTAAGAEGDPVYTDASGVPTLTAAANGAIGFVLGTAATVANGGKALLCPGTFIEGGVPAADIPLEDVGTFFTTDTVEDALQELGPLFADVVNLEFRMVLAKVTVPNVGAGGTAALMTLALQGIAGGAPGVMQVLLVSGNVQYAPLGSLTLSATTTFGTETVGTIIASGAGWALVRTNASGAFACTQSNTADETTFTKAITAQGSSDVGDACVVAHSNSDAATWSA